MSNREAGEWKDWSTVRVGLYRLQKMRGVLVQIAVCGRAVVTGWGLVVDCSCKSLGVLEEQVWCCGEEWVVEVLWEGSEFGKQLSFYSAWYGIEAKF